MTRQVVCDQLPTHATIGDNMSRYFPWKLALIRTDLIYVIGMDELPHYT
jgi:hypothetical protein